MLTCESIEDFELIERDEVQGGDLIVSNAHTAVSAISVEEQKMLDACDFEFPDEDNICYFSTSYQGLLAEESDDDDDFGFEPVKYSLETPVIQRVRPSQTVQSPTVCLRGSYS
eukprot:TRINITY_DN3539_c0_g2_i1.p2 TRINITY_DN3539_c0_g2~~TRINITY_DN3539_c0_g2_i1.p2  ORF type:complete len:113 (+),score=23.45 TRINITY_DN3539_c0_g2_i1:49-387(+)